MERKDRNVKGQKAKVKFLTLFLFRELEQNSRIETPEGNINLT